MAEALISLETAAGEPVAVAPVPPPSEPVAPPEPAATAPIAGQPPSASAEPEEDPNDPRFSGVLRELRRERETRRTAEAKANQLEALSAPALELARALQARPDIVAQLQGGFAPAAAPAAPVAPAFPAHELRELAESLALYGADGKPDLAAAERVATRQAAVAEAAAKRAVEQAVGPIRAERVNDRASQMRAQTLDAAAKLGIDPALSATVIDGIMRTNPEQLASPETATAALLMTLGMQRARELNGGILPGVPAAGATVPNGAPPAQVGAAPTFSDAGSGRPGPTGTLSAIEARIAAREGIKPADWQKTAGELAGRRMGSATSDNGFTPLED